MEQLHNDLNENYKVFFIKLNRNSTVSLKEDQFLMGQLNQNKAKIVDQKISCEHHNQTCDNKLLITIFY